MKTEPQYEINLVGIGYHPEWVHEDYNPTGLRECYPTDDGTWISAAWDSNADTWYDEESDTAPERFIPMDNIKSIMLTGHDLSTVTIVDNAVLEEVRMALFACECIQPCRVPVAGGNLCKRCLALAALSKLSPEKK